MLIPDLDLLPNLFLIGAAKSGTTGLYVILKQHPQVFFPVYKKEPRFFSDDRDYRKGLIWYSETFYAGAKNFPIRGDATPHYLHWSEKVAPRIHREYFDKPKKFLVILRDPVSRAYSHYWHGISLRTENLSFKEALAREDERISQHRDELQATGVMTWGYFRGGCYATRLKPYFDLFPREDFLILLQQNLKYEYTSTMFQIANFLGIDSSVNLRFKIVNEAGVPRFDKIQDWLSSDDPGLKGLFRKLFPLKIRHPIRKALLGFNRRRINYDPMPREIEADLRQRYLPEIQELERMTGLILTGWYPK